MAKSLATRRRERRKKAKCHSRAFGYMALGLGVLALMIDASTYIRPFVEREQNDQRILAKSGDDDQKINLHAQEKRHFDSSGRRLNSKHALYVPDAFIRKKSKGNQNGNKKFVFLHAIGVVYMFLALMVVCDNFFGPALDCMVEKWDIDDDVAGATFMAAGGSAPELATSYMGQFVSQSDIGFGTIVGSAVFNVLFVIACCALVVPKGCVALTWWPLFRDCSYYIFGLLVLAIFAKIGNNMVWYEAAILFSGYIGYVTIMRYNSKFEDIFANFFHVASPNSCKVSPTEGCSVVPGKVVQDSSNGGGGAPDAPDSSAVAKNEVLVKDIGSTYDIPQKDPTQEEHVAEKTTEVLPSSPSSNAPHQEDTNNQEAEEEEEDEYEDPWEWPETRVEQAVFLICFPIKCCLYGSLYDCSNPEKQKYFLYTFFGSLVWLAIFAYLMVVWTTVVGASLGVCDYIMGLTVLAAGTSIPDALSSMYMAREGRGDMAISSSIGSNVFDILVGLPIPVLSKYIYVAITHDGTGAWAFETKGIVWDTVTLLLMVAAVVASIAKLGWVLNMKLGGVMFAFYFFFLLSSLIRNWASCANE